MTERHEVRDCTTTGSRKKFHVYDHKKKREVFHTDSRDRALMVAGTAGDGPITQHLKDGGHHLIIDAGASACSVCGMRTMTHPEGYSELIHD